MTTDALIPQVAARVRHSIGASCDVADFRELLIGLLERPGRILSSTGAPKWPAFVLDTCHVLGGDMSAAVDAAGAVELVVAAIDVVDDAIDGDLDTAGETRNRAINAGVALNAAALLCVLRASRRIPERRLRRLLATLWRGTIACCSGQDLDLRLEGASDATEDQAHEMTCRKSGSLVAMACQAGAAIATDCAPARHLVAKYGTHVGIVAQLLNDIAGVEPDRGGRGTDLQRRKKTLPVAYALRCAREEGESGLLAWYDTCSRPNGQDEERLAVRLRELGAMHFAWLIADIHRHEALAAVDELVCVTKRPTVAMLRRLVPRTRAQRVRRPAA